MENCVIFIIFHYSVAVDGTGFYDVIIMKSLSFSMNLTVWSLTLTLVVQAWYECQLKWSGVPRIIREFHSVWRVVTLTMMYLNVWLLWGSWYGILIFWLHFKATQICWNFCSVWGVNTSTPWRHWYSHDDNVLYIHGEALLLDALLFIV